MRRMRGRALVALAVGLPLVASLGGLELGGMISGRATAQSLGEGRIEARIHGEDIEVFTYRPSGCAEPSLLFVFHGNGRGAKSYRDSARALADRACFAVYAPLFDEERFPNWRYHRGGVVQDGEVLPEEDWTVELVDDLVAWAREEEGRPEAPSFLFGHSAGGQFLSRVAAYSPPEDVERIVVANPSTYVRPDGREDAPYGFDLLAEGEDTEALLRAYLAAPVTVFLGTEDTGSEDLTMGPAAERQGENRLERGHQIFEEARRLSEAEGWPFNWRLVHAEDVGHSGGGMLRAPEMLDALGLGEG